jgi:hypothetical protein
MSLLIILGHCNWCSCGLDPDNVGSISGELFSFPGRTLFMSKFWVDFRPERSEKRLCSVGRKACSPLLISSVSLSA